MSQFTFGNIDETTTDGFDLASYLEQFEAALHSDHSGSTAPSYKVEGTVWRDTSGTPHLMKKWDGAQWVTMASFNVSTHKWIPYYDGTALGNASTKTTGTASGEVPLNSNLGALAYLATVGTSQITDDAVTLAKMAHGTANRLLGYDASGVPVEMTAGAGITISAGSVSSSATSVSQGDLDTSTGTLSQTMTENDAYGSVITVDAFGHDDVTDGSDSGYITRLGRLQTTVEAGTGWQSGTMSHFVIGTLPGGSYGFYPQCRRVNGAGGSNLTFYAQQRYVNASPPIILGGEEAAGFMYLLLDKQTKEVKGHYAADVPPWLYNGPTYARADYISPDKKIKYRYKQDKASAFIEDLKAGNKQTRFSPHKPKKFQAYLDEQTDKVLVPKLAKIRSEMSAKTFKEKGNEILNKTLKEIHDSILNEHYEEITQEIKNADMALLPHPFEGYDPSKEMVIMVGLYCDLGRDLIDAQNAGGDIGELIYGNYLKIGDNFIKGKFAPPGVNLLRCELK